VLPCGIERLPIQAAGVDLEQRAADPLYRLDLDPPGAARAAGRLDRPHVAGQRLGAGQSGQLGDVLGVGVLAQRRQ
jgi:hypothetical protein